IFGHMGILKGKTFTCFPDFNENGFGGTYSEELAVRDGNLITGKGMGASIEFSREIIKAAAPEQLAAVEAGIQYRPY
ncbi:MAG: DJ-1/PfpI family protein, partial [Solobacterium sp.]|nr:DJ-1/PfpI family protein [Solobacterium sp.]